LHLERGVLSDADARKILTDAQSRITNLPDGADAAEAALIMGGFFERGLSHLQPQQRLKRNLEVTALKILAACLGVGLVALCAAHFKDLRPGMVIRSR
jgi:hypothetical protein